MALAFISVSFLPEIKSDVKLPQSFEENVILFFKKIYEGYLFIKSQNKILQKLENCFINKIIY